VSSLHYQAVDGNRHATHREAFFRQTGLHEGSYAVGDLAKGSRIAILPIGIRIASRRRQQDW